MTPQCKLQTTCPASLGSFLRKVTRLGAVCVVAVYSFVIAPVGNCATPRAKTDLGRTWPFSLKSRHGLALRTWSVT